MKPSIIAVLAFAFGLFLTAIAWPQVPTGVYVGIDADKVGTSSLAADGKLDNHIKLTNIKSAPIDVRITDDSVGTWEHPFNGTNWEVDVEGSDLWFAVFNPSKFFNVVLTYADKTIDTINVPVSGGVITSGLLGQVSVTAAQTLCNAGYVNTDASLTITYWADAAPCLTMVNAPLLKVTVPTGGTICAQRQVMGASTFDIWLSKVVPCVHP